MKPNPKKDKFVAFGPRMIRKSEAYKHQKREIRERVFASHREELSRASWWRRLLIRLAMERAIREEIRRLIPPHGLYATHAFAIR